MEICIKKRDDGKYLLQLDKSWNVLNLKDIISLQEHINMTLDDVTREMTFDEFMKAYNPESF